MPIPAHQVANAEAIQQTAASSAAPQVRLIAGPGTGKSSTIEKRVRWLLDQGVATHEIYAVSFTRTSAKDLKERVIAYCEANGHGAAGEVPVSTLHSLALRILRAAGLLERYPVDPLVLDNWELENVFDAEFGVAHDIRSKIRREEIRYYHEAHWSTGLWNPPNYLPPDPPISNIESNQFLAFQPPRTQLYSCVLPGEIIRQCVQEIDAGLIDPLPLLHIRHLIVDEFQDLNPMDLALVNSLIARGIVTFVAGDDDQSVYSFRFAAPSGIQNFPDEHPGADVPTLQECFRCMPSVLGVANTLIEAFPAPNRVPKRSVSLYQNSEPAAPGVVHRWRFGNGRQESLALAASCRSLIARGVRPRDILILLNNQRALGRQLVDALQGAEVPYDPPRIDSFLDAKPGRLLLSLLRIVCNTNDYVALRTLLGSRAGVGIRTCHAIAHEATLNNLNFHDLFYRPLPQNVFRNRSLNAIDSARAVCNELLTWQATDTLRERLADLTRIVNEALGPDEAPAWVAFAEQFPPEMTLEEVRDFMWADNDEQQAQIMANVFTRLGQPVPDEHLLPQRVRIMTMHGAKGLSARIVFVPGLEDGLTPGARRSPYAGLVLEAARLLYVSITRARAACILSFAQYRVVNGQNQRQTSSRFNASLGGAFVDRRDGLTDNEVDEIIDNCNKI